MTFLELSGDGREPFPGISHHGLTQREQHVTNLAVTGLRDAEIAEQLSLSPHTVKQ